VLRIQLILLTLLQSCDRIAIDPPNISSDGQIREYLRLAVGLGERDPDALDYYYGPEEWVADIRRTPPTLFMIRKAARDAAAHLEGGAGDHREFLVRQLRAIEARADLLLGGRRSFSEEARVFFGIAEIPPGSDTAPLLQSIDALLGGNNKHAERPLAARYAVFDSRFTIPAERLPQVMSRALEECRVRTAMHLELPPGEKVSLEYVHNKAWSAYSSYRGNYLSVIEVNTDLALTVDRALSLACHEGYPGHHVFNSLTEQRLVRTKLRPALAAQLTFSPQSLVSEGAASVAPELAFSQEERVLFEKKVLFPLAGLSSEEADRDLKVNGLIDALHPTELGIARRYLDGELEFVRAAEAFRDEVTMPDAEATLRYLNQYRSYVVTYTLGRDLVRSWLERRAHKRNDGKGMWGALEDLIARPEALFH
jgi:hypothetical protein